MRFPSVPRPLMWLLPMLFACAAVAGPAPPRSPAAAGDTTWWAPVVRHGWLEAGVGWMAAPTAIRRSFEAGQGFAAGVEARPRTVWRLRLGGDYQILPANGEGLIIEQTTNLFGDVFSDTVRFTTRSAGWMGSVRAESAVRLPGGIWLAGGGGRMYLDDGIDGINERLTPDARLRVLGAYQDGWAWFASLGAFLDLEPLIHASMALDVHWRDAWRGDDDLRFWVVRVGYLRP